MLTKLREAAAWRLRAAAWGIRYFPTTLEAWLAFHRRVSRYRVLSEVELRATRKSDTVFIFGSGYSLNEISAAEWQAIEAHDTVGFNWFVHQQFVRCDYQLVREIGPSEERSLWLPELVKYFDLVKDNPRFDCAVFVVQTGFKATSGNRAIGFRQLPEDRRVFLWRSVHGGAEASRSFDRGLTHVHGTLNEVVNFAFLMGWKNIVLVGVDLYDRRCFWLPRDELRPWDADIDQPHNTALSGIVESLGRWRADFERTGIKLFAYNPKSLLTRVLPVWTREA